MLDLAGRLARERDFHNERFAGGPRAAQAKFYAAIQPSLDKYKARVWQLSEAADIFELGSAKGENVFQSPKTFRSASGVDISDVAVEQANARARSEGWSNVVFVAGDAEDTKLPSESLDLVFGSGIIHHLDVARSSAEVARLLRPGGRAVFVEPLGHNPLINAYRQRTPEARTEDEHPLLRSDLEIMRRNFAEMRLEFFGLAAIAAAPFHRLPGFSALRAFARAVDAVALRVPGLRWLSWYVLIELAK